MELKRGNCYEANLKELLANNDDLVLVHAMREITREYWGGHAFLLDKKANVIHDYSNEKYLVINKDTIYKEWNIQIQGQGMYFEYSKEETLEKLFKEETYGPWDLTYENPNSENYVEYVRDYFMKHFQPTFYEMDKKLRIKGAK
jgi:hypothetical protein